MKRNLILSGLISLAGMFALSAQATELTVIVNNVSQVPGWTVNSIAGGGYPGYTYVAYQVSNGTYSLVVSTTTTGTYPMVNCVVATSTSGYHVSGTCNNYYVYSN